MFFNPTQNFRTIKKASSFSVRWIAIYALLVSQFTAPMMSVAYANPDGGNVTHGSAIIKGEGTSNVTINQSSNRAVINWNNFSIGAGEKTTFVQPDKNAVAYNRVTGGSPSEILGTLSANGKVILSNGNGVMFAKGSKVDAAGLVVTTHDADSEDFMKEGKLRFGTSGNADASIINDGKITIKQAGVAAFVAPNVVNSGVITADLGKVAMGAGNGFTLDMYGDNLVSFELGDEITKTLTTADGKPIKALVENSGTINAAAGTILLTATAARDVINQAVNVTGTLKASSASKKGGKIILSSSNAQGDSSGMVRVEEGATLSAAGKTTGGTVHVLGQQVVVDAANIDVSGKSGGGSVRIGGEKQGKAGLAAADTTYISPDAKINADAKLLGKGGDVVVWANDTTVFEGFISARGGEAAGNGGFIEVSGKKHLSYLGEVDLSVAKGSRGTLLLDPDTMEIGDGPGVTDVFCVSGICVPLSASSYLSASTVNELLNESNLIIQAEYIQVSGTIDWSTDSLLLLNANTEIDITGSGRISNGYNNNFAADRIPVLLALRTNADSQNNDGRFNNNGSIDFNKSSGAISIFVDDEKSSNIGTIVDNTSWEAPKSHLVSSQLTQYTLLHAVSDLIDAVNNDPNGIYALGRDINSKGENNNESIGLFNGILDGQYCVLMGGSTCSIRGLEVNTSSGDANYGFFTVLDNKSLIRNIAFNIDMNYEYNGGAGKPVNVGLLAGFSNGFLSNVTVGGHLNYLDSSFGDSNVGGVVGSKATDGRAYSVTSNVSMTLEGQNINAGGFAGVADSKTTDYAVNNIQSTSDIQATGFNVNVGGLVGYADQGLIIEHSSATTAASVTANGDAKVGGIAGVMVDTEVYDAFGDLDLRYLDLNDGNTLYLGGLTGVAQGGMISQSRGHITADIADARNMIFFAGGLVGFSQTRIDQSYATGKIQAQYKGGEVLVGGLVGFNESEITQSFASTNLKVSFESDAIVGGLVGFNKGQIFSSYAVGNVLQSDYENGLHGGLVGVNNSLIRDSFSIGYVEGKTTASGGLVARDESGTVINSYWDTKKSGVENSAGGESRESSYMTSADFLEDFTDASPFMIVDGISYPYLAWQTQGDTAQVIAGHFEAASKGSHTNQLIQGLVDGEDLTSLLGDVYTYADGSYYFLLADQTLRGDKFTPKTQVALFTNDYAGVSFYENMNDSMIDTALYGDKFKMDVVSYYMSESLGNLQGAFGDYLTMTSATVDETDLSIDQETIIDWSRAGDAQFDINLAVNNGQNLHLVSNNGLIEQTQGQIVTNHLLALGGGEINLGLENNVANLTTAINAFTLNNGSNDLVIQSASGDRMILSSGGTVLQTGRISLNELSLTGHEFIFNDTTNFVYSLSADVDRLEYATDSTVNLGYVVADDLYLSLNNGATLNQNGNVTDATYLHLGGDGSGNYYFNTASNKFNTVSGTASVVVLASSNDYSIGSVNGTAGLTAGSITFDSYNSTVSQSQKVSGNVNFSGNANYQLTHASNDFGVITGNTTGTLNLRDDNGAVIGGLNATNFYFNSTTGLTQTGALTANTVALQGSGASYTLNNASNDINYIAADVGATGTLNITDATGLTIHGVNSVLGLTGKNVYLHVPGSISQSYAVVAENLRISGGGAINLTNAGNNFTNIAVNGGSSILLRDDTGFDIGSVSGVNGVTGTNFVTLTSVGGTVTQSQSITAPNLVLLGADATYTLNRTSNNVGLLAADLGAGTGTLNFHDAAYGVASILGTVGIQAKNVYLSASGAVSQTARIVAENLLVSGGSFTLTNTSNAIDRIAGNGYSSLNFLENSGFDIGTVNGVNGLTTTGTTALSSTGTVTQSQAISTYRLLLRGTNGNHQLTHTGNAVGLLAAATGTVNLVETDGFDIGTVAAGTATNGVTATNVYLQSGGAVTQSQLLSATNASLVGASYTLNNASNNIGTLSGNLASLSLNNGAHALNVGSVNSVAGITATGAVSLINNSAITLAQGITAGGGGTSITLSSSGVFTNNAGANALNAGTGGRFLVWSSTPLTGNRGGVAHDFKQYNATYGVTAVAGTGSGFLYTLAPTVTPSLTGTVTKQYDSTNVATLTGANYTQTGAIDGDTVTLNNPTSGTYSSVNKGTGIGVSVGNSTVASASNGGATVYGYQVASTASANIGVINARVLTLAGSFTAADKQYDATTGATLNTSGLSLVGVQNSENVTLASILGNFGDANKGTGKTVTLSSGTLGGTANLGNYTLSLAGAPTATANIDARVLTIGGSFTAGNKNFDSNDNAAILSNGLTLVGVQNGENVTLNAVAKFANATIENGKTVSLAGSSLSGSADLGNYVLNLGAAPTATASILSATPTPPPVTSATAEVQTAILNLANPIPAAPVAPVAAPEKTYIATAQPVPVAVTAPAESPPSPEASSKASDSEGEVVIDKSICAQNVSRAGDEAISISCTTQN